MPPSRCWASTSKANKTRTVALPPSAAPLLREWRASGKIVDLQGHYVDEQGTFYSGEKRTIFVGVDIHDCRHDYASRLVRNGVDLCVVCDLLGHSSIALCSADGCPASLSVGRIVTAIVLA